MGRRLAGCEGTTLIEVCITMLLFSMVSVLVMTSIQTASRANAQVDDQDRGLADLRIVTERMSRDLRLARGVDPLATTSQLTVWIDFDSDYKRDADENVTWRIQCRTGVDCTTADRQYDVERVIGDVDTGDVTIVGSSLVSDIAFAYVDDGAEVADPVDATAVQVEMDYDAIVDAYAKSETVKFEVRLRNVE
jgi:type II secretory pathway pseudopilin PulG